MLNAVYGKRLICTFPACGEYNRRLNGFCMHGPHPHFDAPSELKSSFTIRPHNRPMCTSIDDAINRLLAIHHDTCQIPAGYALSDISLRLKRWEADWLHHIVSSPDIDGLSAVNEILNNIRTIAKSYILAQNICVDAERKYRNETQQTLTSSASQRGGVDSYCAWSSWFIAHLEWPYVSDAGRDWLLQSIPDHSPSQLTTWFVNKRKRSGWNDLFRKYGESDKETMHHFMQQVDDPVLSTMVDPEARKAVQAVRDFISAGPKRKKVGDWVDELIQEYSVPPSLVDSSSSPCSSRSSPTPPPSTPPHRPRQRSAARTKAQPYQKPSKAERPASKGSRKPSLYKKPRVAMQSSDNEDIPVIEDFAL